MKDNHELELEDQELQETRAKLLQSLEQLNTEALAMIDSTPRVRRTIQNYRAMLGIVKGFRGAIKRVREVVSIANDSDREDALNTIKDIVNKHERERENIPGIEQHQEDQETKSKPLKLGSSMVEIDIKRQEQGGTEQDNE